MQIELATLQTLVGTAMWTVARVGGIALTAPVFSTPTVPRQIRAAFVIMVSLILIPLVQVPVGLAPFSAPGLVVLASQVVIGAAMGFMLKLVVEAVSFGAQLIAFTMGLSFGTIISPVDGTQSPVLSQFYVLFAVLL
ncbi:MAG TPA: flagellar biosynthetic protein FliR, partial [Mizugakiibacter sp.]|nr:flagellar biosynthetic protein FliR [Mizugakiibacter sp.]